MKTNTFVWALALIMAVLFGVQLVWFPLPHPVAQNSTRHWVNGTQIPTKAGAISYQLDPWGARLNKFTLAYPSGSGWSPNVDLTPSPDSFIQFGWTGLGAPPTQARWNINHSDLSYTTPDAHFSLQIISDAPYGLIVQQSATNTGNKTLQLRSYARLKEQNAPSLSAVLNSSLHTSSARALKSPTPLSQHTIGGWTGTIGKYFALILVPNQNIDVQISHQGLPDEQTPSGQMQNLMQASIIDGQALAVEPGQTRIWAYHLYVGPLDAKILNAYGQKWQAPSLSKALDFGLFGFIARPFLHVFTILRAFLGSQAAALLAFTLAVKVMLYPLTSHTFLATRRLRDLAPHLKDIQEDYRQDPLEMQKQIAALFRAHKTNPLAAILPSFLQAPIFLALYAVLTKDIAMRHAPFWGWIRDMSAPDPLNIFNLFGLLPYNPIHLSPLLLLGAWPSILCLLLYIQQFQSRSKDRPISKLALAVPVVLAFLIFAHLPAGLAIYYSWNSVLSIIQSFCLKRHHPQDQA